MRKGAKRSRFSASQSRSGRGSIVNGGAAIAGGSGGQRQRHLEAGTIGAIPGERLEPPATGAVFQHGEGLEPVFEGGRHRRHRGRRNADGDAPQRRGIGPDDAHAASTKLWITVLVPDFSKAISRRSPSTVRTSP